MNLTTYPLDNYDYNADDAALFHCTRTTGIYAGDDFSFSVSGADNIIKLGPGLAWMRLNRFKGVVAALKNEVMVDMGLTDSVRPRIDRVVLQFDANKNDTSVVVKKGIPASNPIPPERSMTEALYEIHLLEVRREPGSVAIAAKDITDLRMDEACCGLMADSVTSVDTRAINAQVSALIQALRQEIEAVKGNTAFLLKSGDTMTGPLKVIAPEAPDDAAPKAYVDTLGLVTATHSKAGTVHALVAHEGCGNLKFVAAAPYEDGDMITLNGVAVAAKTQDGEGLTGGAWAAGAVVMCLVSPEGGTLFFKGGGGSNKSQIIVTAPTGSTVTATNQATGAVKSASPSNGKLVLRGLDLGTWMITADLAGHESLALAVSLSRHGNKYITFNFAAGTACVDQSAIVVKTVSGATVTIASGATIYTALAITGNAVFEDLEIGEWTIQLTHPEEPDSVARTVTLSRPEVVYVEIAFHTYLFNYGPTGGTWNTVGKKISNESNQREFAPDVTTNGDGSVTLSMPCYSGGIQNRGGYLLIDGFDLSKYKTLFMKYRIDTDEYFETGIYVLPSKSSYQSQSIADAHLYDEKGTGVLTVDVSNIDGIYYIYVPIYTGSKNAAPAKVTIFEVFLDE